MDPNELLKMLDLGAKPARPPDDAPPVVVNGHGAGPRADAGPTALAVDAWGLRRGRDLVAESERLRACGADEFAAADFLPAGFDPEPRLLESCIDPVRHRFLAQLLETPEYRALHADTRLDDTTAAIAAAHFAEQFARLNKDNPAGANTAPDTPDDLAAEMAALRAVGRAVAEARREVGELRDAAAALGLGPGEPGSSDPYALAALFKRVRNDPGLRRICDLAGRFRRVAQSRQRQKAAHGLDDVVGVEPGGDIARLLPSELVRLVVPELELDALRRIVQREAMCREYHAVEPVGKGPIIVSVDELAAGDGRMGSGEVGKGPIIVSVDESGSMSGEKIHTAKALALALAWCSFRRIVV